MIEVSTQANPQFRAQFEQAVHTDRSAAEIEAMAHGVKTGGDGLELTAALFRAGFMAPEALARTYDAAALGWQGEAVGGPEIDIDGHGEAQVPDALWDPFWALVNASGSGGGGALDVTARTADLGRHLSEAFSARLGTAYYAYPYVRETAAKGLPPQFDLENLAICPEGSLGHAFYRQIVDNGFDLEVLDRDVLALSSLAAPHDFINTRMLQSHDLIHLLAGYELTALHEVGISAFQLAQCGHGYSAMFLAVVATGAAASDNAGALPFVLETVLGAWTHGRRSASLISLDWESVWDQPIATIRQDLGMSAFHSPFPADIIEQLAKAA